MNTGSAPVMPVSQRFDELFAALPPPGSAEYLRLLQTASVLELPAQVLVRAYRLLLANGQESAAKATLERLLDHKDSHGYLRTIRRLSRQQVPGNQNWHDSDDLYQAALTEILKVLPSKRGELAEVAWVRFCQNCFEDAWRALHGRRGERLRHKYVEPMADDETGELIFLVEQTEGPDAPWHQGARQSELPRVEKLIARTVAGMQDELMRKVAEDQFGDDPSPISSGRSGKGKPPLTEQLNASRFQISRALRNAKARIAASLIADPELEFDTGWLKQFV